MTASTSAPSPQAGVQRGHVLFQAPAPPVALALMVVASAALGALLFGLSLRPFLEGWLLAFALPAFIAAGVTGPLSNVLGGRFEFHRSCFLALSVLLIELPLAAVWRLGLTVRTGLDTGSGLPRRVPRGSGALVPATEPLWDRSSESRPRAAGRLAPAGALLVCRPRAAPGLPGGDRRDGGLWSDRVGMCLSLGPCGGPTAATRIPELGGESHPPPPRPCGAPGPGRDVRTGGLLPQVRSTGSTSG